MDSCSLQGPGWGLSLGVQSCQDELCWITDGSLLGLSGSLPNHCMCEPQSPVVMVSLSSPLPRQSFPWKLYRTVGKFRSEGTADRLAQPLAQSRVSDKDNPLLVRGWVRWALTLSSVLGKGQWTFLSSWREGQPFMNQVGWHFAFHPQPYDKWWCQSGSIPVWASRPFQPLKKPPISKGPKVVKNSLVSLVFRD